MRSTAILLHESQDAVKCRLLLLLVMLIRKSPQSCFVDTCIPIPANKECKGEKAHVYSHLKSCSISRIYCFNMFSFCLFFKSAAILQVKKLLHQKPHSENVTEELDDWVFQLVQHQFLVIQQWAQEEYFDYVIKCWKIQTSDYGVLLVFWYVADLLCVFHLSGGGRETFSCRLFGGSLIRPVTRLLWK